jgi:hypothetical protein
MKTIMLVVLSVVSFCLLSSCGVWNGGCGEPNGCWKRYFIKTNTCGTYVSHPCVPYCNRCTFNEPECQMCWSCVQRDGCGYPRIKQGPYTCPAFRQ